MKDIDFSKMSNADINLKIMGYTNEYEVIKGKIIKMVDKLKDLDMLYNKANDELRKRGILNNES